MRFYFFILCSLLSYKSAVAGTSFKDRYERADVKIRYDRGYVYVIDKNNKTINEQLLTKEKKINLRGGVNLCISLTDAEEFRIEEINDVFQSYAIDSDKAVSIAGDNYIDEIAIKSKSYIANIGSVIAQSVQFSTKALWNFGGLGEKANFDCTPKIDVTILDCRYFQGFYNLGAVRYDEIKVVGTNIHQIGSLIADRLTQECKDPQQHNVFATGEDIIPGVKNNCKVYTQINKLEGADWLQKRGNTTTIVKNFMGGEVSTKADGSFSYTAKTKTLMPISDPKTSRESCGIPNLGTTCHYNASLQILYAMDTVRDEILGYNGHNRFILAFKKFFQRLQSGTIKNSDVLELLTELKGENPYLGGCEPYIDLSDFFRFLRQGGLNASIEHVVVNEKNDDGYTYVTSSGFLPVYSLKSARKTSLPEKEDQQRSNFGDYVLLCPGEDTFTLLTKSQVVDEIILEGNRYQPIAAISSNMVHCWATVKQLDGTFIQYNDAAKRKVEKFDESTEIVLYKRISN